MRKRTYRRIVATAAGLDLIRILDGRSTRKMLHVVLNEQEELGTTEGYVLVGPTRNGVIFGLGVVHYHCPSFTLTEEVHGDIIKEEIYMYATLGDSIFLNITEVFEE